MDVSALLPPEKNMVEILANRLLSTKKTDKKRIENLSNMLKFARLHQQAKQN